MTPEWTLECVQWFRASQNSHDYFLWGKERQCYLPPSFTLTPHTPFIPSPTLRQNKRGWSGRWKRQRWECPATTRDPFHYTSSLSNSLSPQAGHVCLVPGSLGSSSIWVPLATQPLHRTAHNAQFHYSACYSAHLPFCLFHLDCKHPNSRLCLVHLSSPSSRTLLT